MLSFWVFDDKRQRPQPSQMKIKLNLVQIVFPGSDRRVGPDGKREREKGKFAKL
jgi:hypothetical protein